MALNQVFVGTAATLLVTPTPGAQYTFINNGTVTVFVSNNSGVTVTTGWPLTPDSEIDWYNGYNNGTPGNPQSVYGICATGGTTVGIQGLAT